MTKHFVLTEPTTVSIIFMDDGVTVDVVNVTSYDVEKGNIIYSQRGKPYTLTADDFRKIAIEQVMYLMRTEQFTEEHNKVLG